MSPISICANIVDMFFISDLISYGYAILRDLIVSSLSVTVPSKLWEALILIRFLVICTILHLTG